MTLPELAVTGDRSNLEEWTEWLLKREMPIFSSTARRIYQTMENQNAGAMELSNIILQDASLTARLLKLSNTPYYNPSSQKMSTITRAIVILGYGMISELTLACSFIEEITNHGNKDHLNREMARAIHAAVQAKSIAQLTNDPSPEEIFIAALLKNIGQIVFWCYAHEYGEQIEALRDAEAIGQTDAEIRVLGFPIRELGVRLSEEWKLGGLISEAIHGRRTSRTRAIHLGHRIAAGVENGWSEDQNGQLVTELEESIGITGDMLYALLEKNAETATKIAVQFGAHDAARFIPAGLQRPRERAGGEDIPPPVTKQEAISINTSLQFQILQDIALMLTGPIDINMLMELILEGIHRSIGMDHTLFAMLSPDRKHLKEKFSLGWQSGDKPGPFSFALNQGSNIFTQALRELEVTWLAPNRDYKLAHLYTTEIEKQLGIRECLMMPVHIKNQVIGIFYSDRGTRKPGLTDEAYDCFRHFTQQGNIGLALSRQPGNKL